MPCQEKHIIKTGHGRDLCQADDVIGKQWRVVCKLAEGGFGQVYVAVSENERGIHRTKYVLKVEPSVPICQSQLPMELNVLMLCKDTKHSAAVYSAGQEKNINYIVMEFLGRSLAGLRRMCPGSRHRFSTNTATRIAVQAVESLQDLHAVGILHRDIKPANFLMGHFSSPKKHTLFLIDFGLARYHLDADGNVRKPRVYAPFRGTVRYCSLTAHKRKELGRKDDLISFLYVLYELWNGCMPWRQYSEMEDIAFVKENIPLDDLAKNLHAHMVYYSRHVETLKYESEPYYELLISVLRKVMAACRVRDSDPFDWENKFSLVQEEDRRQTEPKILVAKITEKLVPATHDRSFDANEQRQRGVFCGNASLEDEPAMTQGKANLGSLATKTATARSKDATKWLKQSGDLEPAKQPPRPD